MPDDSPKRLHEWVKQKVCTVEDIIIKSKSQRMARRIRNRSLTVNSTLSLILIAHLSFLNAARIVYYPSHPSHCMLVRGSTGLSTVCIVAKAQLHELCTGFYILVPNNLSPQAITITYSSRQTSFPFFRVHCDQTFISKRTSFTSELFSRGSLGL